MFPCSRDGYFGIYYINYQNNIRGSATTLRHESIYIILLFTRHTDPHLTKKTTLFPPRPDHILQMTSQSVADDVTIARKLRLEYEKNISSSLDIDFIHGDIHNRSWRYV